MMQTTRKNNLDEWRQLAGCSLRSSDDKSKVYGRTEHKIAQVCRDEIDGECHRKKIK